MALQLVGWTGVTLTGLLIPSMPRTNDRNTTFSPKKARGTLLTDLSPVTVTGFIPRIYSRARVIAQWGGHWPHRQLTQV